MSVIREPAVSGTFYPSNPKVLATDIANYLGEAMVPPIRGDILGVIAPHAGYVYSGPVAAYGYKALVGRSYDTVIVIAPSHRVYFEGAALLKEGGYGTPLGVVPVDEDMAARILKMQGAVTVDTRVHQGEHSLEVQLPFLQSVLKDFSLVPIIMGAQDFGACTGLAASISEAIAGSSKRVLVVGSTDLSHYYAYNHAVALDRVVVDHLEGFDIEGLGRDLGSEKTEACGAGPMITTMMLCRGMGADAGKVLKYANSGDTAGDKSAVVGYVSAVFFKAGA